MKGSFYLSELGSDWIIQRHILREQCVALAGPDFRAHIDPVTPADLRAAVRETLRDWWAPMLDHARPAPRGRGVPRLRRAEHVPRPVHAGDWRDRLQARLRPLGRWPRSTRAGGPSSNRPPPGVPARRWPGRMSCWSSCAGRGRTPDRTRFRNLHPDLSHRHGRSPVQSDAGVCHAGASSLSHDAGKPMASVPVM